MKAEGYLHLEDDEIPKTETHDPYFSVSIPQYPRYD